MDVRALGRQPVFRIVGPGKDEDAIKVHIGEAARRATAHYGPK